MTAFQSTRPMRGATGERLRLLLSRDISIHAPHAGRDQKAGDKLDPDTLFQSTRPMRGATFNPATGCSSQRISIHAPHAGRDHQRCQPTSWQTGFQSTRPMRGATMAIKRHIGVCQISIHAPHAGRDSAVPLIACSAFYFNPRAPCGARHMTYQELLELKKFQSTRPMRGATWQESHGSVAR